MDEAAAWRGVEEGPTPEQMSTRHLGNSSGSTVLLGSIERGPSGPQGIIYSQHQEFQLRNPHRFRVYGFKVVGKHRLASHRSHPKQKRQV